MAMIDVFKESRLKFKLWLLAVLPLLLMLAALVVIVANLHQANNRIATLYSDRVMPLQQIKQVSDAYAIDVVDTANKYLAGTISRGSALSTLDHSQQQAFHAWQDYLKTRLIAEEMQLINMAEPQLVAASAILQQMHSAIESSSQQQLGQLVSQQLYPAVEPLNQTLKRLSAVQLAEAQRIYVDSQKNLERVYLFSFFLVVVVLAVSSVLTKVLSVFTLQSVSAATQSTASLFSAQQASVSHGKGELPEVRSHLLETIENIRQQLGFSIEETMKLLSDVPAPVVAIWDKKGRVSSVNYAFERLFAVPREALVGQHIKSLSLWPENEATAAIEDHLKAARQGSSAVFHIQLEINQGQAGSRLLNITASSWRERKQSVTLLLFEDVTAWHRRELWLSNKIARDPLTHLLNRGGFNRVAEDLWFRWKTYEEPFALVMADLNDFKAINDTYGHLAGDDVLTECAIRLQQACRSTDICVRWGGDEFILVLTNCQSLLAAQQQMARIAEAFSQEICTGEFQQQIYASFGCVHVTELEAKDELSMDELLHLADVRMYDAKHSYRQQVMDSTGKL